MEVGDVLYSIKLDFIKELNIKTHKVKSIVEYIHPRSNYEYGKDVKFVLNCTNGLCLPLDINKRILKKCYENGFYNYNTRTEFKIEFLSDRHTLKLQDGYSGFAHYAPYRGSLRAIFHIKDKDYFEMLQIISDNIQKSNQVALSGLQKQMHKLLQVQKITRELTEKELK